MPWLAKQNETQREREKEQERENYPTHGICLLVQASDSHTVTRYLCMDQILDSVFDLV